MTEAASSSTAAAAAAPATTVFYTSVGTNDNGSPAGSDTTHGLSFADAQPGGGPSPEPVKVADLDAQKFKLHPSVAFWQGFSSQINTMWAQTEVRSAQGSRGRSQGGRGLEIEGGRVGAGVCLGSGAWWRPLVATTLGPEYGTECWAPSHPALDSCTHAAYLPAA